MNTFKRTTRHVATFFIVFVAIILLCLLYLKYHNNLSAQSPSNPIALGSFPSSPYWIFEMDGDIIATPAAREQFVYIKTSTTLYSINVEKKRVQWEVPSSTNGERSIAPLVLDSMIIVAEGKSSFAAHSVDTGEFLWRTPEINAPGYFYYYVPTISFNSQYLYVGRYDWNLVAYSLKTGDVVWERVLPGRVVPYLESDEVNVFVGVESSLKILNANSGVEVGSISNVGYVGPMLLNGRTLYIADEKNMSIISVNVDTYTIIWRKYYQSIIEANQYSCISEIGENLLVAAKKLMMISKLDGELVWSTEDLGYLECPTHLNDKVYVRNSMTTLYSFNKESGKQVGRLLVQSNSPTKFDFFRGPVAVNGLLAVPFGDNRLFLYAP